MKSTEIHHELTKLGLDLPRGLNKKVVVGMSGGVDSSVAALILKAQGYDVTGIFMKNWQDDDPECSATEDYHDVALVCEKIDIPYYSLNFSKEYFDRVFTSFLEDYKKGNTPNPDILCNKEIKFNVFFENAKKLGADFLATGHYARTQNGKLYKGLDNNKDQSYFLYTLKNEVLKDVLFPLGELPKPLVRKIASHFDLATKIKKDSTGICFIGERKFKSFLNEYIDATKGYFKTLEGEIIKEHDGHPFYTIGQRKGLGIGGPGEAWFVANKDPKTNSVYVVQGDQHPALYVNELWADTIDWVQGPVVNRKLKAKVRYRQPDQDCYVSLNEQGELHLVFDRPQRAVTIKQSVVLYDGDECVGGAVIARTGSTLYDLAQTHVDITKAYHR